MLIGLPLRNKESVIGTNNKERVLHFAVCEVMCDATSVVCVPLDTSSLDEDPATGTGREATPGTTFT